MVPCLEEAGDIDAEDAAHDLRETEEHGHDVDGEAGVGEERVECDAEGFAARSDAEGVEGDDEEGFCVALETDGEDAEEGEEDAGDDFKGCGDADVS